MYAATVTTPTAHPSLGHREPARSRRRHRPESVLAPFWVFTIVLALLVIAAALPTPSGRTPRTDFAVRRVRVAASDTLWSIAAADPVAGLTTAESVAVMRKLNGLTGSAVLQPGAVISVPCASDDTSNLAMR